MEEFADSFTCKYKRLLRQAATEQRLALGAPEEPPKPKPAPKAEPAPTSNTTSSNATSSCCNKCSGAS